MPHRLALAAIALLAAAAVSAAEPALTVAVAPKDPALSYLGRFDFSDAAHARSAWPGTAVTLRFSGTAVGAKLHSTGADWVQVVVDGAPGKAIELTKEPKTYVLAQDLPAGEHTVQVVKRTESWSMLLVGGFVLPADGKALPPAKRPERRIEFYGDSITCGYGNLAAKPQEKFSPTNSDNYLAYGPVAARALDAEWSCIAVSGIKLLAPDGNDLRKRYAGVLTAWDPAPAWSRWSEWTPQAVVINLGTNDVGAKPEEKAWTDAMRGFIATLRGHYPDCHVYLVTGSMLTGDGLALIKRCLDSVATELTAAGDTRIHRLDFEPQRMEDGIGADWHPGVKTHAKMAEKLAAALKKDLGW